MENRNMLRFGVAPWSPNESAKVIAHDDAATTPEIQHLLIQLAEFILRQQGRNRDLDAGASVQITITPSPDPWK